MQIQLCISPSHSILTPGQPVPSANNITQCAWKGSHWSANFEVAGMTRPCKKKKKKKKKKRRKRDRTQVCRFLGGHRLVGLVVKTSASRAEDPGFESRLRRDFFRARVIAATSKLALQWLPCQAPLTSTIYATFGDLDLGKGS